MLLAAVVFVACSSAAPSPTSGGEKLAVIATTTVLADFVRQVGGEMVEVDALVPKGGEVHTFDPVPSDLARLARSRLLVMNGLGLDDWLLDLARDTGAHEVPVLELGEDLDGVTYLEGSTDAHADDEDGHAEHDDGGPNPHLWLDVSYARLYVERLADELSRLDPARGAAYEANAAAYDARLAELDTWIRSQLQALPEPERRVVSLHDAFPYFAAAYDLEVVGVVVPAPGQEPSAGEVVRLIGDIREAGVKVILAEAQFSDRLSRSIASETEAVVVSELYTDSLGDAPLDSYEAAMRWNVDRIVEGLH